MLDNEQWVLTVTTRDSPVMPTMFGVAQSPFGFCVIAESPHGICHLSFHDQPENEAIPEVMSRESIRDDEFAAVLIGKIFRQAGERVRPQRLCVSGTPFQLSVWTALLQIPAGRTLSYKNLAALLGNPQASRAVGGAVGANRIAFLIPCHRVIHQNGCPGNYRWGGARKQVMLDWEKTDRFSAHS